MSPPRKTLVTRLPLLEWQAVQHYLRGCETTVSQWVRHALRYTMQHCDTPADLYALTQHYPKHDTPAPTKRHGHTYKKK